MKTHKNLSILMVSEFAYPDVGGIETHVLKLSENLITLGNK